MAILGNDCKPLEDQNANTAQTLLSVMREVRAGVVVSVALLVFSALGQHTEGELLAHDTERCSRHREVA